MKRLVAMVVVCAALAVPGVASAEYEPGPRINASPFLGSESRVVPPFTAIVVEGSGEVALSQGLVQRVVVETNSNVLPVVKTEVVGGVLHLGFKDRVSVSGLTALRFTITSPSIQGIEVAGSGSVRTVTPLTGGQLSLAIGGSGSITATVNADAVRTDTNGSGDVLLDGTARDLAASINGSGSIRARALALRTATVSINGSGDADVTASDTLAVKISGSGSVTYGGGARVTLSASGSGGVRQR